MINPIKFKKKDFKKKNYTIVDNKIENPNSKPKVTVITPVYNAEKYLRKTIESVISQTLGIDNIEYILVDDCSKDSSREILLEYSFKFPTIKSVLLKGNTGTPGHPRNIGIELSTAKYITFLDADDWLEPNGLEILFNILEETNDDYIVGKTIEVQQNGTKIVGEHESCKERRNVSPYSIPHIFQHLGPRARMCRTDLLKTNKIYFPEMKFAEDKQFFIDVLTASRSISTTTAPIYYLNRVDNSDRLTNQTNILQKTNCNLKVIQYVIKKNLDVENEKMILNRLYEFDSISRFFNTPHFQRTRLKFIYYYTFRRVLKTARFLRYEFSENFSEPLNKVVYELFQNRKYKELVKLLEWNKKEKIKEIHIKDNLPYVKVPFLDEPFRYIKLPMFALVKEDSTLENKYTLHFKVYGTNMVSITDIIIRNSKDVLFEHHFEVEMEEDGNGRVIIDLALLKHLPPSHYSIYLRFNDYMKINIRKIDTKQSKRCFQNRDYIFYQTKYSNVGLKIKGQ